MKAHSTAYYTIRHSLLALGLNTKVVYRGSSPINVPLPLVSTVIQVKQLATSIICDIPDSFFPDHPTPRFGEALRSQVEERLTFFETGAAPSKNAEALRRVLDDLALEEDEDAVMEVDEQPVLTTLLPEPQKEKKRKRKHDAMDVDEHDVMDEDDDHSVKKVKLSKEEKKALKKAKKEKAEAAANVTEKVDIFFLGTFLR